MVSPDNMIEQQLSPELIARLGKEPDTKLAAEFKVRLGAVKWARRKRGIPGFSYLEALPKNPEFMALLGKASDYELGRRFGCSNATVKIIRESLGVPVYVPEPSAELIAALGTMADEEVAAQFGCKYSYVLRERKKRGIPALCRMSQLETNEEFLSLVGKIPDHSLAYKFGCSLGWIGRYRKSKSIPPFHKNQASAGAAWQAENLAQVLPLLGTVPDSELARQFGGHGSRYTRLRNKRGIAPYQPESLAAETSQVNETLFEKVPQAPVSDRPRRRSNKPTYSIPEEVIARLGTINDAQLSRETGTPHEHIKHYRTWLNIPANRKHAVIDPDLLACLGTMTDLDVAEKFGRKFSWVRKERKKRGIPGFKNEVIPGLIESLGTMHDFEIAEKYGVGPSWVRKARHERGIPVFKPRDDSEITGG